MNLIDTVEIENVSASLNKVASVQAAIKGALKSGQDFDTIPGTNKPTLLKPGAEKILMMFGLTSEYEIIESVEDWNKGVFAYTVRCILSKSGMKITEGLGSCNSKEDKYRYRWVYEKDIPVGVDKETLKVNQYNKYRVENDEIYSQVNTLLKMAKKRAQVDATLTVASLSEVFTQDIEDMKEFFKSEAMDNMKDTDAKLIKINFGKFKGFTLGEIAEQDKGYLEWLSKNAKDDVVKRASSMLMNDKQSTNNTIRKDAQEVLYKHHGNEVPFDADSADDIEGFEIDESEIPF